MDSYGLRPVSHRSWIACDRMIYLLVSFGLLVHCLFWGAGLALLATPARWSRLWPLMIAPCGLALQSAVVWLGAHTTLPGTDSYAHWTLLLPGGLLLWALRRRGVRRYGCDLRQFAGLAMVMGLCLVLLTLPLALASKLLTTVSIGSCDAADYAAGMRVFKEFASNDRGGFLGLTEVVRVASADNFFDYWLKLNHFTPSALMALNGSVLGLEPHELVGIMTVVLLLLGLPMVYLLARATAGLGGAASGWLTLLYGISPITWYGVYQVAPGQLIAAQAIALLTWAGVALWREPATRRRGLAYAGLLVVDFGLIWGAYNFIVIVCLVPALGCVVGWALHGRRWRKLFWWLGWMFLPLTVSGLFFFGRAAGLMERFSLFQQYDFGWKIAPLMPEGWLGIVNTADLRPLEGPWSWVFSAATLLLTGACFFSTLRRGRQAWQALTFVLPVMGGYAYLLWRGARLDNNASYDAYKLFSVFYPVLLVGFCHWLFWLKARNPLLRAIAVGMMLVVTVMNFRVARQFAEQVESTTLSVDSDLMALRAVEDIDGVDSLNILVPDFWARLWANALMLRKAQYFPTHTYEGRLDTPLRGEWDLNGGMLQVRLPGQDTRMINRRFSLASNRSPFFLRARLGDGWHGAELLRGPQAQLWSWSKGDATLELENPQDHPLSVELVFSARSLLEREVQVWVREQQIATLRIGTELAPMRVPVFTVPPGKTIVRWLSDLPPTLPSMSDARLLGFALYTMVVDVKPDDELRAEPIYIGVEPVPTRAGLGVTGD